MAISFVRSLRSLENHSARPSAAALLTAGSLMALWMLWVGFAPVEIHETSTDWQRTREGALVVRFPSKTMPRLRAGQPAELLAEPEPGQPLARWSAVVADTPHRMRNRLEADTVKVELLSGAPPKATPRGSVKILVERVTPLTLMLRAGEPILDATRGVTP
jgi:hypothetical protein